MNPPSKDKEEISDSFVDEFLEQNSASRELISYWDESFAIFSKTLVSEVRKVLNEYSSKL